MQIKKMVKILSKGIQRLEIIVPLKHLSNFWRSLGTPLINYEVFFTLTWSENSVLTDIIIQAERAAQGSNSARERIEAPSNATFRIRDTKLYVPIVTLLTENDKTLLEQFKTGSNRTIKWNKYRSEMTNRNKNNNLIILLVQHLLKSIGCLPYHLKMKAMEHRFQSIMYQMSK